ncbi:unnamed protein product [Ilex paraguariensis]|uniref:O-fucosyltransferase family protein n=1 Tax=Ilex paraguariensis TaxID=185542 RepID=A0ABC8RTR9_9AQUA
MGKQGSPKSPRPEHPNLDVSFGVKNSQFRGSEMQKGSDPFIGRRMSGDKVFLVHGVKNDSSKFSNFKGVQAGKRHMWIRRNLRSIGFTFLLIGFLFVLDSLMCSIFDPTIQSSSIPRKSNETRESRTAYDNTENAPVQMYDWLVNLASAALAKNEFKQDASKFWEEPYPQASKWKPCADRKSPKSIGKARNSTGYILVSANGGLNQQRVAVCNAVAVASLLNATLVIPTFLSSNVWKDPSQFGDIYQEEYFMNILKDEVNIVKELPYNLQSLDLEAIDIAKEATPLEYVKTILPLLQRNGIVHFLGFGNRLGFDPLPFEFQKLRCKCNFHALKFVPNIQQVGSLLIRRVRNYDAARNMLDKQLLGNFIPNVPSRGSDSIGGTSKYLALHMRFEVDMVAYSLCRFGGGENEERELQAYREIHFPLLIERLKLSKSVSPAELRKLGRCPLTPEEAALVLAGVGFKRGTYIYLAGSQMYGGQLRMHPLTSLYPNLVTKEDLLTPNELAPLRNFSSQLAALDFIACATSDVFAITDSGSQLSSLVSGFRTYYGGGHATTLRPSKKRLAAILLENSTIKWNTFEERIRKMIEEGQRVRVRRFGQSIYRHPRCTECMCKQN